MKEIEETEQQISQILIKSKMLNIQEFNKEEYM